MFKAVFIFQNNSTYNSCINMYRNISDYAKNDIDMYFYETEELDFNSEKLEECRKNILYSDFVFMGLHGGIPYFKSYSIIEKLIGQKPYFFDSGIDDEVHAIQKQSSLPKSVYGKIHIYYNAGGDENYKNMLLYIAYSVGGVNIDFAPVVIPVRHGIYKKPESITVNQYLENIKRHHDNQPIIGLLIHYHYIQNHNLKHIDALIAEIKRRGAICIPFYTNIVPSEGMDEGLREALDKYVKYKGKTIIDLLIVTTGFALTLTSSPGTGTTDYSKSIFEGVNVPVIQAITTQYSYKEWRESINGMDPLMLCCNVFQPEFDGQIISTVFATTEKVQNKFGGKNIYEPILERIKKISELAIRWSRLKHIPIEEKKVAIILHNMPPRIDMIGCAYGLDTPESVFNMYLRLKKMGIKTDFDFKNGQEIINKIIEGVTNDLTYISPDEIIERGEDFVTDEEYVDIFNKLSERNRQELIRDWDEAPGTVMHCDKGLIIPGIFNGNIFIGLQPQRAFGEKAEELYHSTDLVCPHQYIAFYKYLEDKFGADVIVHTGTHGTLEWLPGKEVGLSDECYSDICFGKVPHLYLYIIDVPGEGAQAKRRSDAVILDHMIPSMTEAGLYGPYEVIEEHMNQYVEAKKSNKEKLSILAEQLVEECESVHLFMDLHISKDDFLNDVDKGCEKIHTYLTNLKSIKIKDGLHIMGECPAEERLRNMLRLLVCIDNGNVPSLRKGISSALGVDLEILMAEPHAKSIYEISNQDLLSRIDEIGVELFKALEKRDYKTSAIDESIAENLPAMKSTLKLKTCLEYVTNKIYPSLLKTTNELDLFEKGIKGQFVSPGPSGSPSRGNANILPTGRNFYSIDPTTVPSRASWKTGKLMAESLLEKYKKETGKIPENVAIVVYSGDTMKTHGDDIAEIMYLYGVRPVWIENTDRVQTIEIIPLSELGRPRIDVTLRISGLFRDTFPNLIERIEDAVNMVATLPEKDEYNYIKKHIREEMVEMTKKGMSEEEAYEMSSVRVFGCPPGTYGAGVIELIHSKKWKTSDELGESYITWSGHGYTKKLHGKKMQSTFAKKLSKCDVTVKNIVSHEHDMLDDDCFVSYHGGLISAVKKEKGSAPLSINASSADPDHIMTDTIQEETAKLTRARLTNPIWINGLKKHGFKGAQDFAANLDIFFGWDATADTAEDWMYDALAETYIFNDENREWIRENNPYALKSMTERLLEAEMRGMWNCSGVMKEKLRNLYLETDGYLEGQ